MNNILTIQSAKGHISIQDLGRFSAQHLGFSASGAADEYAFLSANQAIGNTANTPLLEIVFGQVTFSVSVSCQMILTGANCQPMVNNIPVSHWQVLNISPNDIITLQAPQQGMYTYVGITDGINAPTFIQSASSLPSVLQNDFNLTKQTDEHLQQSQHTYLLANKLSNIQQEQLTILARQKAVNYYFSKQSIVSNNAFILRFIPHYLWYEQTTKSQNAITQQTFTIDNMSNKMGYRLKSQHTVSLLHESTLSKPVALGAIQVPSDGQPIILMKDRQTMGGYPTIGNIIQVDIPRLAQLNAYQKIQLLPVTLAQAQTQLLALHKRLHNKN